MIKRLIAALALFPAALAAGPAPSHAWLAGKGSVATSTILLGGGSLTSFSNSADRYLPVGFQLSASSSEILWNRMPISGTFKSIRFRVSTAPTSTATWTIVLRKNGADTALTCTITSSDSGTKTCTTDAAITAGDNVSVVVRPTNTPSATAGTFSLVFQPTTSGDAVLLTGGTPFATSGTSALVPFNTLVQGTLANRTVYYTPSAGTIDRLYVSTNAPGSVGDGKKYDYFVTKNASSSMLVTCSALETATTCSDTSNSLSIAAPANSSTAGDNVEFAATATSTPNASTPGMGARFRSDISGAYVLPSVNTLTPSTSVATYYPLVGGAGAGSGTEANVQWVSDSQTISRLAVKVGTAPGAGKSYVYTLRKNGADTALTCTIADTNTFCYVSGASISIANGDLLDTSAVPSGTPFATGPNISYLATR